MNAKQTILLVDDSENDLLLLRTAFRKAEYAAPLQEVHNGEEAISYLKGDGIYGDRSTFPLPALVLLDVNMPMKSGFDVLSWVRGHAELKRLPIIILTASMRPEDVERAYDLGANAFLVKPSRLEDLVAMIRCLRDWTRINQFPPPGA
jgi:CheY-like chemotaxis protein